MRRIIIPQSLIPALRDGRKTQHRVPVKPQPSVFAGGCHPANEPRHPAPYFDSYRSLPRTPENPRGMSEYWCWWTEDDRQGPDWIRCPFGAPGDELWVAETYGCCILPHERNEPHVVVYEGVHGDETTAWPIPPQYHDAARRLCDPTRFVMRSPATMPRWASRFVLTVTDVRVERVQDSGSHQILAEGVPCDSVGDATRCFSFYWEATHGPGAWTRNDLVWVPTFTVKETTR